MSLEKKCGRFFIPLFHSFNHHIFFLSNTNFLFFNINNKLRLQLVSKYYKYYLKTKQNSKRNSKNKKPETFLILKAKKNCVLKVKLNVKKKT